MGFSWDVADVALDLVDRHVGTPQPRFCLEVFQPLLGEVYLLVYPRLHLVFHDSMPWRPSLEHHSGHLEGSWGDKPPDYSHLRTKGAQGHSHFWHDTSLRNWDESIKSYKVEIWFITSYNYIPGSAQLVPWARPTSLSPRGPTLYPSSSERPIFGCDCNLHSWLERSLHSEITHLQCDTLERTVYLC